MTQDEIIEMARQAGMVYREFEDEFANANTDGVDLKTIVAFAKLVADAKRDYMVFRATPHEWMVDLITAEREACAKMVDHILKEGGGTWGDAIRTRGEA
jgi:hypothetical protein